MSVSAVPASWRRLRAADHRRMPWKNGGGETTEIAVHPAGASMEDFGWRISMARVESEGPFSAFPGVDRTLSILDGDGLVLTIGAGVPVELRRGDAPFRFDAGAPTRSRLVGSAVVDLNVMTRRGVWEHRVDRLPLVRAPSAIEVEAERQMLVCAEGHVRVGFDGASISLAAGDALWIEAPLSSALLASAADGGLLYVVRLDRAR